MSLTPVSLKQATSLVRYALKAQLVPYVAGSPGCGKSAMAQALAEEFNLKLIDIRLAQEDPTTINGFPDVSNGRSDYLPPVRFPLETDELPLNDKGVPYAGWLIFFDELPSAPRSIQAAAYKIILDRMIGAHNLHKKAFMMAAGNLATDNAIVNEMGTALRSRMVHIHVASNPDTYIDLIATKLKFDTRIVSYLAYQKNKVNNFVQFNKGSSDETFACERTWEFVNKILKANAPEQGNPIPDELTVLLQGTIGSTALEFVQYTHAFKDLPTFAEILANPSGVTIPQQAAVKWLLMGMLVGNSEMDNVPAIMQYINRFAKEFKFVYTKMLWAKSDKFLDIPEVLEAFNDIGDMMLG